MQCPQCQRENPPQAKFCRGCGSRFPSRCAQCGSELAPDDQFCMECGAPITPSAVAPAVAAPAARPPPAEHSGRLSSPESYTPAHLAERILTSRAAIEGERKQVTVLFADLKGSLELLADRDAEDARRLQDPVLERMMDAVHRYEGTVNQVMGDGIMALFGAPLAHEDHALRACYAALRLQETLAAHAESVRRSTGILVLVRVGLNSGEVVVRSIGSDLKMDYSAVGQTVSLAGRMEQMATPGSILLTPATLGLVEGSVQVRSLGPLPVKGLAAPLEVYELTGAALGRTRFQAAAARGLTRFVGRDAELATLRRTLEQAGAGHGQVVALVGEPGVGKSRLVWEFGHSHRAQGWLVLETRSVSYGKATSYLPVIDLLKGYCGIDAHDDPRRMREKLTGKLLALDTALAPTLPALLALLDVPVDDPAWQNLDPPQRRQRTLDALKRLLLREAQEQPLLVVFEDLHWIDAETQALLDSLVESLPTARLLLLVNYRPEYQHVWASKTYYSQLRLDPLPAESADELLQALLGDDPALAPLKQTLIARTEGNPFFLEESVRTLVETGVLAGEQGSYQLTQPVERTQVPATLQAVLAARIDRLPPEDKRLLQAASVIGKDVPLPLLRAIWDGSEADLHSGLARLQAAEFLYETALFPEPEYTFKHALTHEVTYSSLLQERRRALHLRTVEALEALSFEQRAELIELLARHAYQGEDWGRASEYLEQAGARAAARSAHRAAAAHFDLALDAVQHLPHQAALVARQIDLYLALRNALQPLGEHQRMHKALQTALTLAEAQDDQRRLVRVLAQLCAYHSHRGEPLLGVKYGSRAVGMALTLDDVPLQILANYQHSICLHGQSPRHTIPYLRRTLSLLKDRGADERFGLAYSATSGARGTLAYMLALLGEFSEARAQGKEALRVAEAIDQPQSISVACCRLATVHHEQGNYDQAIPLFERGLSLAQTWELRVWRLFNGAALAQTQAVVGRTADALAVLAPLVAALTAGVIPLLWGLRLMSETYWLAGRREEARDLAHQALAEARTQQARAHEAILLHLLGDFAVDCAVPAVDQTEGYFRQACAIAEEEEMRPLQAHCHLGLGTLYGKAGRPDEARAELETAAAMYRGMEMAYWLAKAETASVR